MALTYNFIIDCSNDELVNYINIDFEAEGVNHVSRGIFSWCFQTFHRLRKRGNLNVICSNKLIEGAINIIHSEQLLEIKGSDAYFIVCVCADYPKRSWAHFYVVQNKKQLSKNTSFVPHWIQPGLIKRDPARKGVLQVAYAGQHFNGNLAETPEFWEQLLKSHGLSYITLDKTRWHDLSAVDVLIGIRSFDTKPYNTKPPTKLFNAWHAHIPFIGGFDSAFEQVGTPGIDYFKVNTREEVIKAILRLKNETGLYEQFVENGLQKSKKYTCETIGNDWENILTKPVLIRYNQWLQRKKYEKVRHFIMLRIGLAEHKLKTIVKKLTKI